MNRLQELRKQCGYTQQDLCNLSRVNISTIQKLERGANDITNANVSIVMALARTLNTTVEELIRQSEKPKTDRKRIVMKNWNEILEQNRETIESMMVNAYENSLRNPHMQFSVCVEEDGNTYLHGESAGSNFIPKDVWEGKDVIIKTYCNQYFDFDENVEREEQIEFEVDEYKPIVTEELDDYIMKLE